jgi:feruloyl-CoA synthase
MLAFALDEGRFAPAAVHCRTRPDGGYELVSPLSLPEPLELIGQRFRHWSRAAPDRVFLAERSGSAWREITYAAAERLSAAIGEDLLGRGLDRERPILILGEASCAQGLLRLAALRAGIPFVPVSPSLLRFGRPERLRTLMRRLSPGAVALSPACLDLLQAEFRTGVGSLLVLDPAFLDRAGTTASAGALARAESGLTPDSLAAVFLTSGSTGEPKGVEITHRMIAANQAAYGRLWRFLDASPPVMLDWLPWHHTFGGNDNLHKALWFGGSYHIDDGQPTPERLERSLANIREVAPTIHLNVPRGLAMLVERLEADRSLFERFFERLELIFFAGAGLGPDLWGRLRAIVARATSEFGREVSLVSGYGTTEAGSTICLVHFPIGSPRMVGLPIPGLTLRLVPEAEKLEVRVKGASVTPGYWRYPERTQAAFDTDGFLRTGDAARFADSGDPASGLVFDGRLGEDFKLASGTWVSVGPLRLALLAAIGPLVREVLIEGHERDRLGAVLFLDNQACANFLGVEASGRELAADPRLRAAIAAGLARHNRSSPGSSTAVARALIDPEPPSPASGEVSDKGSLNQRLGLRNRGRLVEILFAEPPSPTVILPAPDRDVP